MAEQRQNGRAPGKKRLLTGLRPTGKFHLGNYVGTFEKDLELQNSGEYECFFLIADYHSLTTGFESARTIGDDIREGVLDFLAVGIDPNKSTLYLQSLIPEVSELFLLFTMLVSATRAQRIPTLKEQVRDLKLESASLGVLSPEMTILRRVFASRHAQVARTTRRIDGCSTSSPVISRPPRRTSLTDTPRHARRLRDRSPSRQQCHSRSKASLAPH